MKAGSFLERVAGFAVRRPWPVIGLVAALATVAAVAALRLEADASTETLVDEESSEFRATEDFRRKFGDDPAVILVRENLRDLVLTRDLRPLFELETCLAGGTPIGASLPRQQAPLPAVCDEIAELAPSRVVYGPATFLYESVAQIQQVLRGQIGSAVEEARAAGRIARQAAAAQGLSVAEQQQAAQRAQQAVLGAFQSELVRIALRFRITSPPSLDDPGFVTRVVFDPVQGPPEPKERFNYLFPSSEAALIQVRLRPDLSDEQREQAIGLFRRAVDDPRFALRNGDYVVSGIPAVVEAVSGELRSELLLLLAAAILVMAAVLALVLAPPLRLLPLGIALLAAALTFGLLALLGGPLPVLDDSLTMASIAVLPVLIGLAVDYAIQFQARFNEAREGGEAPARAATIAARAGGPVIGTACLATAAGFAALALSPIPMVRSFGLLLVVGVAIAFLVALSAGFAALALAGWRQRQPQPEGDPGGRRARLSAALARRRAAVGARLDSIGTRAIATSIAHSGRVLAAATVLAVSGWIAGAGTSVVSDVRDLAPSSLQALRDINTLQEETGVSGEVDVVVRSDDLTNPELITWIAEFQQRVLERHGFSGENPSCEQAEICPLVSLTDLFAGPAGPRAAERIDALLEVVPPYFSQAVVTRNPVTGGVGDTANIAFGIRVQPLDQQQELIEDIRSQIDPPDAPGPPEGTEVRLAGLSVIAAAANEDLSRSRWWLPLVGLAAVALALFCVYRSGRRVLVPLIPIVLATGWSALLIAVMDVSLNPMSATLGALVIAIATEFSVILSARYEGERSAGLSVGEALRRTYSLTGAAVLASGATAIAGFAALAATDIRMLRDFGLVTVADLAVALGGVLLVLPAVLVWAEEGFPLPDWLRRRAPRARPAAERPLGR